MDRCQQALNFLGGSTTISTDPTTHPGKDSWDLNRSWLGKNPSRSPVVVVLFRALSNKSNKWLELTAKYVKAENPIKTWTSDASRSIATLRALQQPSLLASLANDWTPATSKSRWYCFILLYINYLPLLQACVPCGLGMIYVYIIWYDTMYSCRDMFYDLLVVELKVKLYFC